MLNGSDKFSNTARTIITVASTTTVGNFIQLLLDCSALPEVIFACQEENKQVAEDIFWFNAEMPIEEVPRLSTCPAPAMLSKIPDNNATRNTKLSPNVIGDPRMQMQTCQHANLPTCQHADLLNCLCATCLLANMPKCWLANMPTCLHS